MTIAQSIADGLSYLAKGFDQDTNQGMIPLVAQPQTGTDPTAAMSAYHTSGQMSKIQIPKNDRPPYYLRILIADYQRDSWLKVGSIIPKTSIELPIPLSLVDQHTVNWEADAIGISGALAMDASANVSEGIRALGRGTLGAALNLGGRVSQGLTGFGQGLQARLGYAINNYLTMMMQGPTYKAHKFTWRVSPNSAQESEELMKLYTIINNAQAPTLSWAGSAFFQYPKIFNLSFHHESGADMGRNLYRFKPVVLRNSSWNFGPEGPAFYGETKAPESVEFGFEFVELEFWLGGDFGTDNRMML